MHRFLPLIAIAIGIATSGCSSSSATYTPPLESTDGQTQWSRTIERSFDETWTALVDHISGTFFAIDSFEKDSGLMTLSFGVSGIGDYVDGGRWIFKQTKGAHAVTGIQMPRIDFDGNYVEFLERYRGAQLSGRMNVFVQSRGTASTEVKVRARYVVTNPMANETWSFDTRSSATLALRNPVRGTPPTRTLRPTHRAERKILDAVEALAE